MVLPDFLVIGAQRSGSTWLHQLLASHPSIYMPTRRKEVHFFNKYYDRGLQWYSGFFPSPQDADAYTVIGEATPTYLYKGVAPERIHNDLPEAKLMLILRNPAERAFSQYVMLVQFDNYRRSFEELLEEHPGIFEYGLYGRRLREYLKYFDRSQFCILEYEEAVSHLDATKAQVASFLGVAADRYPEGAGEGRVGGSYVPNARRAYALAKRTARWLQSKDLDWTVNLAKAGVKRVMGARKERPRLSPETRHALLDRYEEDILLLEELFDLDLSRWRAGNPTKQTTQSY